MGAKDCVKDGIVRKHGRICVAPTVLGLRFASNPALTRWANLFRASGASAKKFGFVGQVGGAFVVEVLRASPVNTTGVQTPDLVGCPQNDTSP